MARKAGQWEEEEVTQSQEEEERCQPAMKRRYRVTGDKEFNKTCFWSQVRKDNLEKFQNFGSVSLCVVESIKVEASHRLSSTSAKKQSTCRKCLSICSFPLH
ncbi:hypothetical protein STEG23_028081 [Scotinomys teguina]